VWRNFLVTFLLRSLRYAFSRSREKRSAGASTSSVLTKDTSLETVNPEGPSHGVIPHELIEYEGNFYRWDENPPDLMFSRASGTGSELVQFSFWAITAIAEGLKKGDLSLCELIGLEPDEFASTLRNAGVPHHPSVGASNASSDIRDTSPGSPR
jgi:hypothetical protein